jgi:iron complex transport system permease protein
MQFQGISGERQGQSGRHTECACYFPARARVALSLWAAAAIALLMAGVAGSLFVGEIAIDAPTVRDAVFRHDPERTEHVIVRDGRLPRAVAAVLVGASLAVAGAIMQAVTRNPLASPGIMGLNTGASFAMVLAMAFGSGFSRGGMMLVSVAGAALGAALVYSLGSLSRSGLTPVRLALTGIAVSTLLGALGNGVTIYFDLGQDLLLWSARGTEAVQWPDVAMFLPFALFGLLAAWALAPSLGVLALGNQVARGLGQRTKLVRLLASAIVLALAGGAVAVAGPIGFVGLMVPHLVRSLVGMDHRRVIPGAALLGALLVLSADVAARWATAPLKTPVPVSVVTALFGVPFFLYLICRRKVPARAGRGLG